MKYEIHVEVRETSDDGIVTVPWSYSGGETENGKDARWIAATVATTARDEIWRTERVRAAERSEVAK